MTPALGRRGEDAAAEYLERRGWTILDRGYRYGRKEIDLVARSGEVVVFVEVKARTGEGCGHPLEAITPIKRADIGKVADNWISRFGLPNDAYRFDAIAVRAADGQLRIEHIEDAWGILS